MRDTKCPVCGKMCNGELGLAAHSSYAHGESLKPHKPVECPVCKAKFSGRQGFVSHYKAVHVASKPSNKSIETSPSRTVVQYEKLSDKSVNRKVFESRSTFYRVADGNFDDTIAKVKKSKQKKSPPPVSIESLYRRSKVRSTNPSAKYSKKKSITCVLCGKMVKSGTLLEHKRNVHGENESPPRLGLWGLGTSSGWVTIWQGGLPGLGKRR